LLAIAAALCVAPQLFFIPIWLSAPCLLLTLICAWSPPPPLPKIWRIALFFILVASMTLIALYYRRVWGREPGVSLLTVMVAAKLLEVRTSRDAMVVWCAAAVLLVALTIFDQELFALSYMLTVLVVLFTLLDVIHDAHDQHPVAGHLRQAMKRLALGVPIALVLFVFSRSARTGLSESMRMGQISQLVKSEEVAFRVEFDGSMPPRDTLYWRGPVLDQYLMDGDTEVWESSGIDTRRSESGRFVQWPEKPKPHETKQYAVTLQPHQQRWLFALDLPGTFPKGGDLERTASLTPSQQLINRTPIREPIRYEVASVLSSRYPSANRDAERNLATGDSRQNPRARAWAQEKLAESSGNPTAYFYAVLRHVRTANFSYTTRPPLATRNAIDAFWLDNQRGFCEHYAGAFTFLMRSAGIPARVVTGYLGGEVNPQNNLLVVRQSDAHAWAEVLIDGHWMRVDPTAAIAPSRIELDLSAALPESERSGRSANDPMLLNFMRHSWDAAQHTYTAWLLGYDRSQQLRAIERFGLGDLRPGQWVGIMLLLGVAAVLATVALYTWRERAARKRSTQASEQLWLTFLARARKHGVNVPANITPRKMVQQLVQSSAHGAVTAKEFLSQLELARYSAAANLTAPNRADKKTELAKLRKAFRAISK
jgi:protein-glutamine gamma-glutamyltransferase